MASCMTCPAMCRVVLVLSEVVTVYDACQDNDGPCLKAVTYDSCSNVVQGQTSLGLQLRP
ncbi:hypothetical protein F751_1308 [Auxenochlorella protothecoides]|uniref:Uncharacterized protein n=1 Tax=Auxenochlorella protothecoides TaxID=3075 RepID=A0A087SN31_AUXPR|nr:hypothetical protein F751_1308 [Auxenochlorella protothecoides]KFM27135.1 hypothetical protein F751_1308 [Auxenochlorella protothecoides]